MFSWAIFLLQFQGVVRYFPFLDEKHDVVPKTLQRRFIHQAVGEIDEKPASHDFVASLQLHGEGHDVFGKLATVQIARVQVHHLRAFRMEATDNLLLPPVFADGILVVYVVKEGDARIALHLQEVEALSHEGHKVLQGCQALERHCEAPELFAVGAHGVHVLRYS